MGMKRDGVGFDRQQRGQQQERGRLRQRFQDYGQNMGDWIQQAPFTPQDWGRGDSGAYNQQNGMDWFRNMRQWRQDQPQMFQQPWGPVTPRPGPELSPSGPVTPLPGPQLPTSVNRPLRDDVQAATRFNQKARAIGSTPIQDKMERQRAERQAGGTPIEDAIARRRAERQAGRIK